MVGVRKVKMMQMGKPRTMYAGVLGDFEGPAMSTPAAAKKACLEAAARVLTGHYHARFLRFGEYTVAIWRQPVGNWLYAILQPETPTKDGRLQESVSAGYEEREEAERAARRRVAQLLMNPATGYAAEEIIEDAQDRRQHLRQFAWQRAYYEAHIFNGLSDEQARNAADLHQGRGLPIEEAIKLAAQGYGPFSELPARV